MILLQLLDWTRTKLSFVLRNSEIPPVFFHHLCKQVQTFRNTPLSRGKRITLEHTLRHHFRTQPFCITLEHKIKHLMETPPYTHTSDLLTGARLWKKNAFQSETNTKNLLVWEFDSFQPCHKVPRLPRKRTVDVQKCHTCHAKWRSMSKGPTPATENEGEYMKQKPCCTWCKKSNETFRIYMLLHLM